MNTQSNSNSAGSLPQKHSWKIWWELIRPHTLTAGFVPVFLGSVLAFTEEQFNLLLFAAMLIASLLIQAATNLFNEYYDFKKGLDTEESVGIGGGIVRYGMSPSYILKLALGNYGLALLLGIYICAASSWWIALIGLICMLIGYLYTGGPFPISSTPFGELFAGLFMGFLIILIAYFIQTSNLSAKVILTAIPIGILVGLINLGNNLRDHDGDKACGRKTLPIVIGPRRAIYFLGVMYVFTFFWLIGLVVFSVVTPWALLALLSFPKAMQATRGFVGKTSAIEMMPAMKASAQTNTFFGLLLAIGIFIGHFL